MASLFFAAFWLKTIETKMVLMNLINLHCLLKLEGSNLNFPSNRSIFKFTGPFKPPMRRETPFGSQSARKIKRYFETSAQLNFWLNWVNFWIFWQILACYNCAQVSYLISQNSSNNTQLNAYVCSSKEFVIFFYVKSIPDFVK